MGKIISIAPYLKRRHDVDVVTYGRWTLLQCGDHETALGPRQVLSLLDALDEAPRRGVGYGTEAAGGLLVSGDKRGAWIRCSKGTWAAPLNRRELGALIGKLKQRAVELRGKAGLR